MREIAGVFDGPRRHAICWTIGHLGSRRRSILIVALGAIAGCSFPHSPLIGTDAVKADIIPDALSDALMVGPYTNVTLVASLDTPEDEDDPTLPADMLEIYFERSNDIWRMVRSSLGQPWSAPAIVAGINTGAEETTPEISADGLTLTFASRVSGDYDLYVTTRASRSSPWLTPIALDALNSSSNDYAATLVTPALLYFSSSRPGAGNTDLLVARATMDGGWSVTLVDGLSTAGNENEPWVDLTETRIYFTGDGANGRDLYTATRPDAHSAWGPREAVREIDDADNDDGDAWVSADGHTMYFSSDRFGDLDIFMATR